MAALVRVERSRHACVERVSREQLHAAGDGESEQHRAPGSGAGVDERGQLVPREQIEQCRGGDETRAGELVPAEPGDVGQPGLDGDAGRAAGALRERQQVRVAVV